MNKTVMVVGASSGIGETVSKYLGTLGYNIILVARNTEKLERVATEIVTDSMIVAYDLQNIENIEDIFSCCKENNWKLDGMVYCAGISIDAPARSIFANDLEQVTTVNYSAFVECCKYFHKKKYSNEGGAIVAISSMGSLKCEKGMCTYSASKAAMNAAVKVFAKEFASRKQRVNAILPAFVNTPMYEETLKKYGENLEKQCLGIIEPIDVAYMVEFLLSEKARFVTGAEICISGGAI